MLQSLLVPILLFATIFVLHGASYLAFANEGKVVKFLKECGKLISRVAFGILVTYWLHPYAAIITLGFAAGLGYYAERHASDIRDAKRPRIDIVVEFLRKTFKITEDSVNHGRLGLAFKGLLFGHVLYLTGWEVKRLLVQNKILNNEWANFVQDVINGSLFGLLLGISVKYIL